MLHFCSIDIKLSVYKDMINTYTLLELAIWKSKIMEQTDGNIGLLTPDKMMERRIDSLSMVEFIVPNVHSFLWSFVYTRHSNQVPRNVTHVRVHHSVEVIEQDAFKGCEWLTVVELGKGLGVIRRDAFLYCTSLKHFQTPPTLKAIYSRAFEYCSQSTTVRLREGLERIGPGAFHGCTNLRAIFIQSSITLIGKDAFDLSAQSTRLWNIVGPVATTNGID